MGIKVQLQDAKVEIGGQFQEALKWVKSLPGRKYDPATKTWSVPMDLKAFRVACALPLNILSGSQAGVHVTRYGNPYGGSEWAADRSGRKAEQDALRRHHSETYRQLAALKDELEQRIASLTMSERGKAFLAQFLVSSDDDLADLEEDGRIAFSSEEVRTQAYAIEQWYADAVARIYFEEDAVASQAKYAAHARHGLN